MFVIPPPLVKLPFLYYTLHYWFWCAGIGL